MGLPFRAWDCPSCGEHHAPGVDVAPDVDVALNILAEGIHLKTLHALDDLAA
ncbi:hypothetical protein LDL08_38455 [Nonomuraea glycinis]|uniref:Uncharacterized protein n=1 Tax=Nonomuraea glycinis TaxID=2047744 RepID=A0A918A1F5_9ACTN|nr:hypothetical protein [Nonomuraea glycinis]MCA2182062.1 hypothetical protein [Nonomuraea glycinis]GGP02383.1 hypothetical protein GCM10012278_09400 [Nonomuraea glycinis]